MISGDKSHGMTVPRTALEALFSNLSQALHATAQPLSILRAGLGNQLLEGMSAEDLRELASSSAIEIERVCNLFNYLQHFVSAESSKPELSAMSISTVVAHDVEGVELLFKQGGISLRTRFPDASQRALINRTSTLEALSSVLLTALGLSRREDTVELSISTDPAVAVQILVQNVNAQVTTLSTEASLAMALAESLFRSQQGTMSWSLQPFAVQIELLRALPVALCEREQ